MRQRELDIAIATWKPEGILRLEAMNPDAPGNRGAHDPLRGHHPLPDASNTFIGTNWYNAPVIPTYANSASQMLYLPDELEGFNEKTRIRAISFRFTNETCFTDYSSTARLYIQALDDTAFPYDNINAKYRWFPVELDSPLLTMQVEIPFVDYYYGCGELTFTLPEGFRFPAGKSLLLTVINEAATPLDNSEYPQFFKYDTDTRRTATFASDHCDYAASLAVSDYVANGQTYYYLVEFNNKTGYNIDAVTIERNNYWEYELNWCASTTTKRFADEELIVMDSECVKIAFIVNDYTTDNSGGRNFSYVTKVEYSNELLGNKQKDAGRICSPLFANGVRGDVVEIKTASDLLNMSKSAYYVLANDIDLSGSEWKPNTFNGMFDGQGHTISGINFVGTVENGDFYWGLFSQANGIVRNLNLQGRLIATITSSTDTKYTAYVGGLCGMTHYLAVENVRKQC